MLRTIFGNIPWFIYPLILILFFLLRIIPYIIKTRFNDRKVNLQGFEKIEGIIKGYDVTVSKKTVTENGERKEIETKFYNPIIEYTYNDVLYTFLYKTAFAANFEPNRIGETVFIYIDTKMPENAKGLFTDIYNVELQNEKKANIIISIILFILCLAGTLCSIFM